MRSSGGVCTHTHTSGRRCFVIQTLWCCVCVCADLGRPPSDECLEQPVGQIAILQRQMANPDSITKEANSRTQVCRWGFLTSLPSRRP